MQMPPALIGSQVLPLAVSDLPRDAAMRESTLDVTRLIAQINRSIATRRDFLAFFA